MTTPITTFFKAGDAVADSSTATYRGQLVDGSVPTPQPIGSGVVSTLTLDLIDTATGATVNGVSQANILNTGRGTLDSSGNLTITLQPADTAILRTGDAQETRSMVIDAVYPGGTLRHRVDINIVALGGP